MTKKKRAKVKRKFTRKETSKVSVKSKVQDVKPQLIKKGRGPSGKQKHSKVMKLKRIALQKTVKKEPRKWGFSLFRPKKK